MENLALVSRARIPSTDASSVSVLQMANSFSNEGLEVFLYCDLKSENLDGIRSSYCVNSSIKFENYISNSFQNIPIFNFILSIINSIYLSYKLNNSKVDVVYSRDLFSLLLLTKANFAYEAHKPFNNILEKISYKIIMHRKNFIRLICISAELKKIFLKKISENNSEKFIVAHDGATISTNSNYVNSSPVVGYIGSLHRGRGFSLILNLASLFPHLRFVIIGGGRKFTDITNLPRNVIFIPHQSHSKVRELMSKIDILLAPYQKNLTIRGKKNTSSYRWMSPLKIFEYMSMGKVIICSDFKVLREVLRNNENSLLVKHDDINSWQRALLSASKNKSLREKLGKAAKENFLERYTWDKRARFIKMEIQNDR